MTFKDLLCKLQALTPEQLNQEVMFVRYGACTSCDWPGLAQGDYYEDSSRVTLEVEHNTVYYMDSCDCSGITNYDVDPKEAKANPWCYTEVVPANIPFFAIHDPCLPQGIGKHSC